jgi:hypothetical protein
MPILDDDEQREHSVGSGKTRWRDFRVRLDCVHSSVVGKRRPGVVVENVDGQGTPQ